MYEFKLMLSVPPFLRTESLAKRLHALHGHYPRSEERFMVCTLFLYVYYT